MKKIEELSDNIEDELRDAEKYIKLAFDYQESDPATAADYHKLSVEEMNHVGILHNRVVAVIEAYRKEHGEPSEIMMDRYNYLHKKHMKLANIIKAHQMLFKT